MQALTASLLGIAYRSQYVVGAVDGVQIKIQAPSKLESAKTKKFFCRKQFYSLNVQAICDARTRYLAVSIVCPGSAHDSVAYANSDFPAKVAELPGIYHIVADAAYPCSDRVLCPFPGRRLEVYEDSFNYHQSQVRMAIERSFGILVARWGILWRPLRTSLQQSVQIIRACMLLHTYCVDELADADATVPAGVFDSQGKLSNEYSTGSRGKLSQTTGVCVMREVIRQQLRGREQRRPE